MVELKPTILVESTQGYHNLDLPAAQDRLIRGHTYRDLSTICIVPTRGSIHARVVQSWLGLITPMNQKFVRIFVWGMEVGDAYNSAVENILNHPELSNWKYILTLEEDNMPPPDGLMKLYESIEKFDVVGGLYWTKGEGGQPMVYGDPDVYPRNYIPQIPRTGEVQACNGLGMGFNLFRLNIFKEMEKPWFKTIQEYAPGEGTKMMTQDLYFFDRAAKTGHTFASDNRVLVGHYDEREDKVW